MPLQIQPVVEADLEAITGLEQLGFANDPVMQAIFPAGASPAFLSHYTSMRKTDLANDPTVRLLKAVDAATGEFYAFAEWHMQPERTLEQLDSVGIELPEDANVDLGTRLIRRGIGKRHEIMGGKPYAYLAVLVTSPEHRKKGAGSMLIGWGTKVADEQQIPSYLEATPAGAGLYRKHGFEQVAKLDIDLRPFKEYDRFNLCMVRPMQLKDD